MELTMQRNGDIVNSENNLVKQLTDKFDSFRVDKKKETGRNNEGYQSEGTKTASAEKTEDGRKAMKNILVIGSVNLDFVVSVEHTPVTGETILAGDMEMFPGGKGANQAFAIGRLGGNVSMLSAVGSDQWGDMMLSNLSGAGVDVSKCKRVTGVSTGNAWITVNRQGDNSIIVIPGANHCVTPGYIDQNLELIQACDIVIMQLEIPVETVLHIARLAKAMGKTVILDPAPAKSNLPEELYSLIDIIKPNEGELAVLTGTVESEYAEGARRLLAMGCKNVLVSLGEKGVYYASQDGQEALMPGRKVDTIDTTAAGDSFIAGLAVTLAGGAALEDAIAFGQDVAAITVTRKGAQNSIPSATEIKERKTVG